MILGHRVLGLIPARGGSKRLPGKNIAPCAGRPLIAWTIQAARQSRYLDRIVVSTDSPQIADVSIECLAPVLMRPPLLATDQATSGSVVAHALKRYPECSICVLLQPTSPLRTAEDIDLALDLLIGSDSLISVSEDNDKPNGAIYAFSVPWFVAQGDHVDDGLSNYSFSDGNTVLYRMPADRSIDVDTLADLQAAEARL